MEEELLSDREAALYLKLSPKWGHETLRKWVKEGLLPAGRVGDKWVFRKRDLINFAFSKS